MARNHTINIIHRIKPEIEIRTSRSGGPGGQHVNKTETRVQLFFNIPASRLLSEEESEILLKVLASRLTGDGTLIISSESGRSQLKNKELAFKKLDRMLSKAFTKKKKRKPTKPTKAAKEKRLKQKRQHSEKKQQRGKYKGPIH
jgi:ribosome-associated protein